MAMLHDENLAQVVTVMMIHLTLLLLILGQSKQQQLTSSTLDEVSKTSQQSAWDRNPMAFQHLNEDLCLMHTCWVRLVPGHVHVSSWKLLLTCRLCDSADEQCLQQNWLHVVCQSIGSFLDSLVVLLVCRAWRA